MTIRLALGGKKVKDEPIKNIRKGWDEFGTGKSVSSY